MSIRVTYASEEAYNFGGKFESNMETIAFANIFMGTVESQILHRSVVKPLVWKRYIDDIFSIWNTNKDEVTQFMEQVNSHHPTIKFTAEVSDTDTTFLDTSVYKGERFANESILDIKCISNQLKHFSTHISLVPTHQGSTRASLKEGGKGGASITFHEK